MAGRNGKYAGSTESNSIGAVSSVLLQIFEHMIRDQFREIPRKLSLLQAKYFTLLKTTRYLLTLKDDPTTFAVGSNLKLSPHDFAVFQKLKAGTNSISAAVKSLNSRKTLNSSDTE